MKEIRRCAKFDPHSSKQHTRGSGIVRGRRLEAQAHPRARGQGVRVPVRTLHALAGQTHTMVLGCRGVKEAPNGARAWRDDWKYGGVPRTGAQDALRCLV